MTVTEEFSMGTISAVLFGECVDSVYLYVHGKNGNKEDAAAFADIAYSKEYQVLSVDLPNRADCKPWEAVPILQEAMCYARSHWSEVSLYAVSIGAWFSMLAFGDEELKKCLLVSPVLDMKMLIENMMIWASVSENELERRKLIPTDFGETLDYEYYQYAKGNPINVWSTPTEILYAENDDLTNIETVEKFTKKFGSGLTVFENGEHWFHTEEQLAFLRKWESEHI